MARFIGDWWYLISAGLIALAAATWIGLSRTDGNVARLNITTGWLLVALMGFAPFAIASLASPRAELFWDLYMVFLGTVFLLAFFQPDRAFVLRGLQRIAEVAFVPGSKVWLLGLGVMLVVAGLYDFARRHAV